MIETGKLYSQGRDLDDNGFYLTNLDVIPSD